MVRLLPEIENFGLHWRWSGTALGKNSNVNWEMLEPTTEQGRCTFPPWSCSWFGCIVGNCIPVGVLPYGVNNVWRGSNKRWKNHSHTRDGNRQEKLVKCTTEIARLYWFSLVHKIGRLLESNLAHGNYLNVNRFEHTHETWPTCLSWTWLPNVASDLFIFAQRLSYDLSKLKKTGENYHLTLKDRKSWGKSLKNSRQLVVDLPSA